MWQSILRASLCVSLISFALPGAASAANTAALSLSNASATLSQTSDPDWTLEKTGEFEAATSIVTWTITATPEPTTTPHLVVSGALTLTNLGTGSAPLGNLVVNLQTKGSKWVTRASDVADATNGDAATTALVVAKASSEGLSSFSESAASGSLRLADAITGAPFSLAPQVSLASGASLALRFSASFDNDVLGLAPGSAVRAELLVSFGNAAANASSAANLDIDGSGTLDADEAHVRSVPARFTLGVPSATPGDGTVLLSDTLDDLSTTGSVSVSDVVFDLGATSGTVSALVDAGADGGTITNCAHLTGSQLDLEACDTQTIEAPPTCTPGAPGCGWEAGDMLSHVQGQWGDPNSSAGNALATSYAAVYAGGILEVGIAGSGGFSMLFNIDDAVQSYLPQSTAAGALTSDLINPTITSSGVFGGEVVALQLNVDFSDADLLPGSAPSRIGDLRICDFGPLPLLNGQTVRQFLATANTLLGGGSAPINISQAAGLATLINSAFADANPSVFAQNNLVAGACPTAGDMLTFNQSAWGDPSSIAGTLLGNNFDNVYAATGVLEVGIDGASGFSMTFSLPNAVLGYLPAVGVVGVLSANLVNPTSSSSGAFGGDVVALALNVDFSDAGLLPGSAPSQLGDLRICNFSPLPVLNGQTVRGFLGTANTILGGGAAAFGAEEADTVTNLINNAFANGNPSVFAQNNLVNGACPTGTWQPGDMTTFNQTQWGDPSSIGGITLTAFDIVYTSTGGILEVGIGGSGGFSILFRNADAVLTYLPAAGSAGPLTSDLLDPSSSASGVFGGEVVALSLNVDFDDAGFLAGTAPTHLGDLRICNFMLLPAVNGMTVREFLANANTLLGGGSATFNTSQAAAIANFISNSFVDGSPSSFAQDNLVIGTCP